MKSKRPRSGTSFSSATFFAYVLSRFAREGVSTVGSPRPASEYVLWRRTPALIGSSSESSDNSGERRMLPPCPMPVWPCEADVSNVPSGDRARPISPAAAEPQAEEGLVQSTRSLPDVEALLPRDLNKLMSGVSRELLPPPKPLFCVPAKGLEPRGRTG